VLLTCNYGGDTCRFAPRVLPAQHDNTSGGEGGFQYSGAEEFQVSPIFISTSDPPRTFTLGNAPWYPASTTAPAAFSREEGFLRRHCRSQCHCLGASAAVLYRIVLQRTETPALQ